MGNSNSKTLPAPQMSDGTADREFPTTLHFTHGKFMSKMVCRINEPGSEPTFSVSTPGGLYSGIVLHDGPSRDDPALATAKEEMKWKPDFAIELPAIESAGASASREILRHISTLRKNIFWFGFQVGQGESRRLERFEWRPTRGSEIKSLNQASTGWKLVRMSSEPENEDPDERVDGISSDGKEIVAMWANSKLFSNRKDMGEFQVRGSGATGELGIQWRLMALMSCFCIWLRELQEATESAGSSSQ